MWSMSSLPGSVTTTLLYGASHWPAVTRTLPVGLVGDGGPTFGDQDFLSGVLAVAVGVRPMFPSRRGRRSGGSSGMADTVTRSTVEELLVVAVAAGRAGGEVGAGVSVGGSAVGVAVGATVAVGGVGVAVGTGSVVGVGACVAVGVGSGVSVGAG